MMGTRAQAVACVICTVLLVLWLVAAILVGDDATPLDWCGGGLAANISQDLDPRPPHDRENSTWPALAS